VECLEFGVVEFARRPERMEPRAPERLIGVDVPEPGEPALVEERRLDRSSASRERFFELFSGEAAGKRLFAQAAVQVGLEFFWLHEEPGSEPADVSIHDVRSVV
jgi:hypothetical protein